MDVPGRNTAVSGLFDTDLLQHLAYDNLDMLIVDFYTLQTIYSLYFTQHVILDRTNSLDLQQIVRVNATFGQFITGLQNLTILNLDTGTVRDQVGLALTSLRIRDDNFSLLLGILQECLAADLCNDRKTLRLTCLEQLLDTGKTLCDIVYLLHRRYGRYAWSAAYRAHRWTVRR